MNRLAAMWAKEETRIAARGSAEVRADEARRAKRVASEAAEAAAKKKPRLPKRQGRPKKQHANVLVCVCVDIITTEVH